jgi:hypothetical protein
LERSPGCRATRVDFRGEGSFDACKTGLHREGCWEICGCRVTRQVGISFGIDGYTISSIAAST